MTQTHTPGPWHDYTQSFPHEVLICTLGPCANYDSPVLDQIAWTPKNPYQAGSDSHEAFKAQSRANARLLAAAPELLAALQGMMKLRAPDLLTRFERADIINTAIDALCKAEGRELVA